MINEIEFVKCNYVYIFKFTYQNNLITNENYLYN